LPRATITPRRVRRADKPASSRAVSSPLRSPAPGISAAKANAERAEAPHVDPTRAKPLDLVAMSAVVALPFIGCVAAIIWMWYVGWMGWLYLAMLLVGAALTEWGITIGFHRLLTHRSFETHRWLRAVWTWLGALAVQGSPLVWCAVHRKHHQASDQDGDP